MNVSYRGEGRLLADAEIVDTCWDQRQNRFWPVPISRELTGIIERGELQKFSLI